MSHLYTPISKIEYPELFRGKLVQGVARYTLPNKKAMKKEGKFAFVAKGSLTPYLIYFVNTRGRLAKLKQNFPEGFLL